MNQSFEEMRANINTVTAATTSSSSSSNSRRRGGGGGKSRGTGASCFCSSCFCCRWIRTRRQSRKTTATTRAGNSPASRDPHSTYSTTWNGVEMTQRHVMIEDQFEPRLTRDLRRHVDGRFSSPLNANVERFVWDYWHVPGQYTLCRTPCEAFFPEHLYSALENAIIEYGETKLGCRGISPMWLSYYVDGCRQEFHTDSPHGEVFGIWAEASITSDGCLL